MGRPPKREGERLSKNRTFRVRDDLDDRLCAAAEAAGRSVSEEIEHRLIRSFLTEHIELEMSDMSKRFMRIVEERIAGIEAMIDKRLPPAKPD